MNKREALIELAKGNKVRCIGWMPTSYLYMDLDTGKILTSLSPFVYKMELIKDDDELVIYEEPKVVKKVRYAPVLYKFSDRYAVSPMLYKDERTAKEYRGDNFVRWLIDTPYAVEVEE